MNSRRMQRKLNRPNSHRLADRLPLSCNFWYFSRGNSCFRHTNQVRSRSYHKTSACTERCKPEKPKPWPYFVFTFIKITLSILFVSNSTLSRTNLHGKIGNDSFFLVVDFFQFDKRFQETIRSSRATCCARSWSLISFSSINGSKKTIRS